MTKYHGKIGFVQFVEKEPSVWVEDTIEREYKGDVTRNFRRWDQSTDSINPNLNVTNTITIVADDFMINNSHMLRYAEFMGSYWEIKSIELDRPRLTLELGGVYHKQESPKLPEEPETFIRQESKNNFGER